MSSMSEVTNVKVTKSESAPAQDHAHPKRQYVIIPLPTDTTRRVWALKTRCSVEDGEWVIQMSPIIYPEHSSTLRKLYFFYSWLRGLMDKASDFGSED